MSCTFSRVRELTASSAPFSFSSKLGKFTSDMFNWLQSKKECHQWSKRSQDCGILAKLQHQPWMGVILWCCWATQLFDTFCCPYWLEQSIWRVSHPLRWIPSYASVTRILCWQSQNGHEVAKQLNVMPNWGISCIIPWLKPALLKSFCSFQSIQWIASCKEVKEQNLRCRSSWRRFSTWDTCSTKTPMYESFSDRITNPWQNAKEHIFLQALQLFQ